MRPPASRLAVPVLLVVAVALAGCGGNEGVGSPGPGDLERVELDVGARVTVDAAGFEPRSVTVSAGELVEFTNDGDAPRRLVGETDGELLFDSGDIYPGETFLFLFEQPGRVEYHVRDDPDGAAGVVEVVPPEADR